MTNTEKENLRLFLRFLKDENAFGRFLYCTYTISRDNKYNMDEFLKHLESRKDLALQVPFPWVDSDSDTPHNSCGFWDRINDKWIRLVGHR